MTGSPAVRTSVSRLPDPGDTDTIEIGAGETVYRQGVGFTCNSDYACTVTLTNNVDTIVVTWASQTIGSGTADVAVSYANGPITGPEGRRISMANAALHGWALPEPGEGWTRTVPAGTTRIIGQGRFTCPADGPDCRVNIRNHFGTLSIWWSRAMPTYAWIAPPSTAERPDGCRRHRQGRIQVRCMVPSRKRATSSLSPTSRRPMWPPVARLRPRRWQRPSISWEHPGTFELQGDFVEIQAEPTPPAADPDPVIPSSSTDDAGGPTINADGLAIDPSGWRVHALERDWAHRLPDDPEDAPLYGGFETNALIVENIEGDKTRQFDELFTLTAGELTGLTGDPTANAGYAEFDYDGQANTYQNQKGQNEDWRGSFANVPGVYRCTTANCWLVKDRMTGMVRAMADDSNAPHATDFATLEFVPDDPKAMASVADWAYQTFGVWLTTPQNDAGQHSIGQIATSGGVAGMLPATATEYYDELEGSASYRGLALGYYAVTTTGNEDAGSFTATAALTANFDTDMLGGTVSNFHDANGEAMDEFVVNLEDAQMTNGAGAAGTVTGHGMGIPWTGGAWQGTLGGVPDANVEGVTFAAGVASTDIKDLSAAGVTTSAADYPTAVTGNFDAFSAEIAVTGAFGADLQPPASN